MGVNIQTIKDIRVFLSGELDEIYREPEKTAVINLIIRKVLGISKMYLLHITDQTVTRYQAGQILEISAELKTGKPVQYVLGETSFYDCLIRLNSSTLIPRPETEELVHLIISENKGFSGSIIDFGTGSGCIAIALAANLKGAEVTGIDISEEALKVARENAVLNNVPASFLQGDIFRFDYTAFARTGIIVSNPPYVRDSEKQLIENNVLGFEPHTALFVDDSEPLVFYDAILKIAGRILSPGGSIYFEINEAFGNLMLDLVSSYAYSDVRIVKDINGRDRFIRGTKNG